MDSSPTRPNPPTVRAALQLLPDVVTSFAKTVTMPRGLSKASDVQPGEVPVVLIHGT